MLRHERACDAAQKTTKERRSFGLEEVHPGEPYGRPNSPQSPKNKQTASACLIGHIWGFVAASAAVVALTCIFRAFLRRRLTALLAEPGTGRPLVLDPLIKKKLVNRFRAVKSCSSHRGFHRA